MKDHYVNKILPLTIRQLKKAEIQLKSKKRQLYEQASYEFIVVVARVIKISNLDVTLGDGTDNFQLIMYHNALRKSAELHVGKYYRFTFSSTKNAKNGGNFQLFGFDIVGITKMHPNQITIHLAQCLSQKIHRQQYKKAGNLTHTTSNISSTHQAIHASNPTSVSHSSNSSSNVGQKMVNQIKAFCKQLGQDIELQKVAQHFESKYMPKQIQKVLEMLSEQGVLLNLGLAYQWVQQQVEQ